MRTVMEDATPLRAVPRASNVPTAVDTTTGEIFTDADVVRSGVINLKFLPDDALSSLRSGLGTRQEIQTELDDMAAAIRRFYAKQPDQVMRECAAYTARLTELCVLLHRVEGQDRQYTRVRTQQVERWLTELERQFKIASRLIEVQRQDIALSGAAT